MRTLVPFWSLRKPTHPVYREVDSIFDRFFDEDFGMTTAREQFWPATEIHEDEKSYFVSVDLPGLKKEDIRVELKENQLTISGERAYEEKKNDKGLYKSERSYGSFHRAFTLPASADSERVDAKYENGVLELVIPKKPEARPRSIEIKTN